MVKFESGQKKRKREIRSEVRLGGEIPYKQDVRGDTKASKFEPKWISTRRPTGNDNDRPGRHIALESDCLVSLGNTTSGIASSTLAAAEQRTNRRVRKTVGFVAIGCAQLQPLNQARFSHSSSAGCGVVRVVLFRFACLPPGCLDKGSTAQGYLEPIGRCIGT